MDSRVGLVFCRDCRMWPLQPNSGRERLFLKMRISMASHTEHESLCLSERTEVARGWIHRWLLGLRTLLELRHQCAGRILPWQLQPCELGTGNNRQGCP